MVFMAIGNSWVFTETRFKAEEFLNNTGNAFRLVSQRPYASKKKGYERDNNIINTFDVTILNNKDYVDIKKGEYLKLIEFIPEKSFVIGFDLILRFKDVEKINVKK